MAGGLPMIAIGLLYLVFEDFVLNDFATSGGNTGTRDYRSRAFMGMQVSNRLVGLSILILVSLTST